MLGEFNEFKANTLLAQHGHGWTRFNQVEAHSLQALRLELQYARHAVRNVDDPRGNIRTTVIDAYDHRPSVS